MEKVLGKGNGHQEIEPYKLVQAMTPAQKKAVSNYLVGKGMMHGGGPAQYGGFLGMLAFTGVSLGFDLVSKLFGKGMQVKPPQVRTRRSPPTSIPQKKKECTYALQPFWEHGTII